MSCAHPTRVARPPGARARMLPLAERTLACAHLSPAGAACARGPAAPSLRQLMTTHARTPPPFPTLRAAPSEQLSDCPAPQAITCPTPPQCPAAGAVVQLAGTCASGLPGAALNYLVDGVPATTATCPAGNRPLVVSVRQELASQPDCSYNATTVYSLARGGGVHQDAARGPAVSQGLGGGAYLLGAGA